MWSKRINIMCNDSILLMGAFCLFYLRSFGYKDCCEDNVVVRRKGWVDLGMEWMGLLNG